ncbi:peptide deformylase [Pelagibius litoralis]|uniref:Peptide deformylase n=1 Tax=Pelagibius litoralis TaxID=374515 RepID=A0A967EVC5_9PROT|nr:peptide deformylase [Pelagibius litoralis]NIA68481.1 peptide deformylase [Pelagibius litoralis]
MAILKIARMGHPILRRRAKPVGDPTAPEIHRLVRDMLETMDDAGGTGLAAPQVHAPLRVVVFFVTGTRAAREGDDSPDERAVPLTILVNPEIEVLDDTPFLGPEACLSVPGLIGQVPRPRWIRYRGYDLEGEPVEREATGFHARVVQHECDHLDGILYPQRMTDLSLLAFTSEGSRRQPGENLPETSGGEPPSEDEVLQSHDR